LQKIIAKGHAYFIMDTSGICPAIYYQILVVGETVVPYRGGGEICDKKMSERMRITQYYLDEGRSTSKRWYICIEFPRQAWYSTGNEAKRHR
jgi:hypothetical protein